MITTMRRCVALNDLWPWPISSRSFGLDLENRVRSVAFTVLDGFFLYLAQMITIIRECVVCYVFFKNLKIWIFSKFLKFFGLDLEKKNLQFLMDSFHIWHKWSLVWKDVLHIWPLTLTYIFKVIWPWPWKSCPLCSIYSSWWILSIFDTNDR